MRNLHRITGAAFHHAHPECDRCVYRRPNDSKDFSFRCPVYGKALCCPKDRPCRYFVPAPAPEAMCPHGITGNGPPSSGYVCERCRAVSDAPGGEG